MKRTLIFLIILTGDIQCIKVVDRQRKDGFSKDQLATIAVNVSESDEKGTICFRFKIYQMQSGHLIYFSDALEIYMKNLEFASYFYQTKIFMETFIWHSICIIWDNVERKMKIFFNGALIEQKINNILGKFHFNCHTQ